MCTYIHNALAEAVCCSFPRNTLNCFHYDVDHQGIDIYLHINHSVFFCQFHAHAYVLAETGFLWFSKKIQCLHNFNHDDVRRVTELYLSTKFSHLSVLQ